MNVGFRGTVSVGSSLVVSTVNLGFDGLLCQMHSSKMMRCDGHIVTYLTVNGLEVEEVDISPPRFSTVSITVSLYGFREGESVSLCSGYKIGGKDEEKDES